MSGPRKKLYRSRTNRVFTGLAGGIGEYFNIDPTLVRIALVLLEFFTAGLLIFLYLIIAIFVPLESQQNAQTKSSR